MSQDHAMPTPPLAAAVVTVGVTGHRNLAEPDKLSAQVSEVLNLIDASAADALADAGNPMHGQSLHLRIVSSLAEGADRVVAHAALARGATLQCVLPLPRADYATDFKTAAAKRGFTELLKHAERVFELDGAGDRPDAYLAAGRMVVRQSDVLIAVWDGEPARGTGGTAQVVADALARRVPVVWLKPDGAPPVILSGSLARRTQHNIAVLDEVVRRLVSPPEAPADETPATSFKSFVDDRFSWLAVPAHAFDDTTRLITGKVPRFLRGGPAHSMAESRRYWAEPFKDHAEVRAVCAPCLDESIETPFARADMLATRYAGLYRSSYLANFVLSAAAVAVALLGSVTAFKFASIGEILCILAVIVLTIQANRRHYHERWIEYRHLAEQIRPLRYLFTLGLTLPPDSTTHYLDKERGKGGWSHWLAHRLERRLGLPNVVVTPAYLRLVRAFASHAILQEQVKYHADNVTKLARIEQRLHTIGQWLFGLTLAGCFVDIPVRLYLDDYCPKCSGVIPASLTFITGLLPALGAAVLGIRNVGEFTRLEMRSRAMGGALAHMRKAFDEDEPAHLSLASLSDELEALAQQMMSETADWRTLVITRRIELPS